MKKKNKFPSAETLVKEAYKGLPKADLNSLHSATFKIMMKHRQEYYKKKVKDFLNRTALAHLLSLKVKTSLAKEMLKPLSVSNGKKTTEYSNFMEEASRRISQVFQPISRKCCRVLHRNKTKRSRIKKRSTL